MMAQFVTMCVLRHYRDLGRYARQQRESRWHYELPRASYDVPVGIMGIGLLGGGCQDASRRSAFRLPAGAARRVHRRRRDLSRRRRPRAVPRPHRDPRLPTAADARDALYREPRCALSVAARRQARQLRPRGHGRRGGAARGARGRADRRGDARRFETEPLPSTHPFWTMDQVLVLPHTASIAVPEIAARDVVDNIRRLRAGQPLLNIVDRSRGY